MKLSKIIHIHTHTISEEIQEKLIQEALRLIAKENELAEKGQSSADMTLNKDKLFKALEAEDTNKNSAANKSDKLETPAAEKKLASIVMTAKKIEETRTRLKSERQDSQACVLL